MDTKSKITPGPWIANFENRGRTPNANAKAIASVPDLIKALEEIIEYPLNVEGYNSLDAVRLRFVAMKTIARAALAKAGA